MRCEANCSRSTLRNVSSSSTCSFVLCVRWYLAIVSLLYMLKTWSMTASSTCLLWLRLIAAVLCVVSMAKTYFGSLSNWVGTEWFVQCKMCRSHAQYFVVTLRITYVALALTRKLYSSNSCVWMKFLYMYRYTKYSCCGIKWMRTKWRFACIYIRPIGYVYYVTLGL